MVPRRIPSTFAPRLEIGAVKPRKLGGMVSPSLGYWPARRHVDTCRRSDDHVLRSSPAVSEARCVGRRPMNDQNHFVCCRIRVGDDLLNQDPRDSRLQSHISRRVPTVGRSWATLSSNSWCQSRPFRARREASMHKTAPTCPEHTSVTSLWNPGRSSSQDPERPKSASIVLTSRKPSLGYRRGLK
jgi:hypothetical protein